MKVFIITGTSRGIGAALSKSLLHDNYHVVCLSRGENEEVKAYAQKNRLNYCFYKAELTDLDRIPQLMAEAMGDLDFNNFESIALVNNAAVVGPLKPIDQCGDEEIINHIRTNMLSPMLLTKYFIKHTNTLSVSRTVVNMSSGSADFPAAGMSMYCSSKAGLRMFTQCVSIEQDDKGVRFISFDPGMVDTGMQKQARSSDHNDLPLAAFFRETAESGQLRSADAAAEELMQLLIKPH